MDNLLLYIHEDLHEKCRIYIFHSWLVCLLTLLVFPLTYQKYYFILWKQKKEDKHY